MKLNFWPFKRNQDDILPEEVKDYYESEKREKAGVAGMLAIGTLLLTVALALGLFYSGRWVYRTVFDRDNGSTQQVSSDENQQTTNEGQVTDESVSTSRDSNADQATTETPTSSPPPPQTQPTSSSSLPRTGPELDL